MFHPAQKGEDEEAGVLVFDVDRVPDVVVVAVFSACELDVVVPEAARGATVARDVRRAVPSAVLAAARRRVFLAARERQTTRMRAWPWTRVCTRVQCIGFRCVTLRGAAPAAAETAVRTSAMAISHDRALPIRRLTG